MNPAKLLHSGSKQSAAHLSNLCQNKNEFWLQEQIALIGRGFYSNGKHQGKNGGCFEGLLLQTTEKAGCFRP